MVVDVAGHRFGGRDGRQKRNDRRVIKGRNVADDDVLYEQISNMYAE
jgi:hypothetical protein